MPSRVSGQVGGDFRRQPATLNLSTLQDVIPTNFRSEHSGCSVSWVTRRIKITKHFTMHFTLQKGSFGTCTLKYDCGNMLDHINLD